MIKWEFNFEAICDCFPELNQLRGVKQNPLFHGEGDVFCHTKKVCEALLTCKEWEVLGEEEKKIVYLAAAFHDIGKLICTREVEGEWASPKHTIIGPKVFRALIYKKYAAKYEIDFKMREQVAALIRYHGLPLLFMEKANPDYALIKASLCTNLEWLYLITKADVLGRICDDQKESLQKVDYYREYAMELGCYKEPMKFFNSYSRYLYLNEQRIWYGEEVYDPRSFDVYIMVGIPLSGKDTYIAKHLGKLPMISLDVIRERNHLKPKEHTKKVVAIAKEEAKVYLRQKQSFVWNATNIMHDTRSQLCKFFTNYGARVKFIYLEVPYELLMQRYQKRERVVPMEITLKMMEKMDRIEAWEGDSVSINED